MYVSHSGSINILSKKFFSSWYNNIKIRQPFEQHKKS